MNRENSLTVAFRDRQVRIPIQKTSSTTSPHTGREVLQFTGDVHAGSAELSGWFQKAIQEEGSLGVSGHFGNGEKRIWVIAIQSYSLRDQDSSFSLSITEKEELSIHALVIDDLRVQPYEYVEEFSGNELMIIARLRMAGEQNESLEAKIQEKEFSFFPVVREGIQGEPREMRFGRCLWSTHDDYTKHEIVLVGKGGDKRPPLNYPDHAARLQVTMLMGLIDELNDLLKQKGILSSEELDGINARAMESNRKNDRSFYRLKDVDAESLRTSPDVQITIASLAPPDA